jgi:hypothetical protein
LHLLLLICTIGAGYSKIPHKHMIVLCYLIMIQELHMLLTLYRKDLIYRSRLAKFHIKLSQLFIVIICIKRIVQVDFFIVQVSPALEYKVLTSISLSLKEQMIEIVINKL